MVKRDFIFLRKKNEMRFLATNVWNVLEHLSYVNNIPAFLQTAQFWRYFGLMWYQ